MAIRNLHAPTTQMQAPRRGVSNKRRTIESRVSLDFGQLRFDRETGHISGLSSEIIDGARATYPGLNVRMEITRMECWLLCNRLTQPLEQFFADRLLIQWRRFNAKTGCFAKNGAAAR